MAIKAAAGYPQYSGNLIHPMFSADVLRRFYCSAIFPDITTKEYSGEIERCGDQITFFREFDICVRESQKDGGIKHDTLTTSSCTMTIDRALQYSIKFDMLDEFQICNFDTHMDLLSQRASYKIEKKIDQTLFEEIPGQIDPANIGLQAGLSGQYNLGAPGAPVTITSDNVIRFFSTLKAVLRERCIAADDFFLILPPIGEVILADSQLRFADAMGGCVDCSVSITGKLPAKIMGFDVYISECLPQLIDPVTQDPVYYILAGHRAATGFAAQMSATRRETDKDCWDIFYQGRFIWGWKVFYPEALTALYARFA
jgi:hypothetical protein